MNKNNDDSRNKNEGNYKSKGEIDMMNDAIMIEKKNKYTDFKKASNEDVLNAIKKSHKKHKKTMNLLAK